MKRSVSANFPAFACRAGPDRSRRASGAPSSLATIPRTACVAPWLCLELLQQAPDLTSSGARASAGRQRCIQLPLMVDMARTPPKVAFDDRKLRARAPPTPLDPAAASTDRSVQQGLRPLQRSPGELPGVFDGAWLNDGLG
jgi:hypothetical protein